MESHSLRFVAILVELVLSVSLVLNPVFGVPPCEFPAIFNFGDSNSDTGGLSAAFGQAGPVRQGHLMESHFSTAPPDVTRMAVWLLIL